MSLRKRAQKPRRIERYVLWGRRAPSWANMEVEGGRVGREAGGGARS